MTPPPRSRRNDSMVNWDGNSYTSQQLSEDNGDIDSDSSPSKHPKKRRKKKKKRKPRKAIPPSQEPSQSNDEEIIDLSKSMTPSISNLNVNGFEEPENIRMEATIVPLSPRHFDEDIEMSENSQENIIKNEHFLRTQKSDDSFPLEMPYSPPNSSLPNNSLPLEYPPPPPMHIDDAQDCREREPKRKRDYHRSSLRGKSVPFTMTTFTLAEEEEGEESEDEETETMRSSWCFDIES